ncbi:MAG TPA: hypothetical protein VFY84_09480 [Jiangellales bacterium]|nr:hypothetical protein [Jiangellales bacterium]
MDIAEVFTALATAVNGSAIQGTTLQVTATAFAPDVPTVPHFFPAEIVGDYDRTFGGLMEVVLTARLMLSRATDSTGHLEAVTLASPGVGTISAAIDAARGAPGQPALSGACDDLHLRRVTGPRLYDYGTDGHFFGLEFTIFVMG